LLLASGTGAAVGAELLRRLGVRKLDRPAEDPVARADEVLDDASRVISEVEAEIREPRERLTTSQLERSRRRLEMDRDELIALIRGENRRAFLQNVALNAVFFGLGVGATFLIT
jgi:hypothetical protein